MKFHKRHSPSTLQWEMKQNDSKLMLKSIGKSFSYKILFIHANLEIPWLSANACNPNLQSVPERHPEFGPALQIQSSLIALPADTPTHAHMHACTHTHTAPTFPPPGFAHLLLLPFTSWFPLNRLLSPQLSLYPIPRSPHNSTHPKTQLPTLFLCLGSNG